LYAFHGQQAVCFSYDDRASLVRSSGELISALEGLSGQMQKRQLSCSVTAWAAWSRARRLSATGRSLAAR